MKRVPLWVIVLSFPGIALSSVGCNRQDAAVSQTHPVSEQMSEVQNTLGTQAQQALDVITRDNERQQMTEALQLQQQKEFVPRLSVGDE